MNHWIIFLLVTFPIFFITGHALDRPYFVQATCMVYMTVGVLAMIYNLGAIFL